MKLFPERRAQRAQGEPEGEEDAAAIQSTPAEAKPEPVAIAAETYQSGS